MVRDFNNKVEVEGFKSFHSSLAILNNNVGVYCVWLALGGLG
jgi:hypothetical protein